MTDAKLNRMIDQLKSGKTSPELEKCHERAKEAVWEATTAKIFPKLKGKYKQYNKKST